MTLLGKRKLMMLPTVSDDIRIMNDDLKHILDVIHMFMFVLKIILQVHSSNRGDAAHQLERDESVPDLNSNTDDEQLQIDDFDVTMNNVSIEETDTGGAPTGGSPSTSKLPIRRKRSRKSQDDIVLNLEDLNATFRKFVDVTQQYLQHSQQYFHNSARHMENVYISIEQEDYRNQKREIAIGEVMKLQGLEMKELFDACSIISSDPSKIDMFLCFHGDMRLEFVKMLVKK